MMTITIILNVCIHLALIYINEGQMSGDVG